ATFFQASTGRLIKQLNLVTNVEQSQILGARDGKFIARTGHALRFYSAAFEEISSRLLSLKGEARNEWWETQVSPSGSQLWLAHFEDFGRKDAIDPGTEVQVLNPDSLRVLAKMTPKLFNDWWAGDDFATVTNPNTGLGDGVLHLNRNWNPVTVTRDED